MYVALDRFLTELTEKKVIPALEIAIIYKEKEIFSKAYGSIYETGDDIWQNTLFDIASLTKIFSGICFMKLVEQGAVGLDEPISKTFDVLDTQKPIEKQGQIVGYCDASKITWRQALTHTTGMGWSRPKTRPSLPHLDHGLNDIFALPLVYQPGERVEYSDLPIILMGKAMEQWTDRSLDELIDRLVIQPTELENTMYRRLSCTSQQEKIAPTEYDDVFRKCRIWGVVHDENAYLLDGVSAHAGIFSTASDIAKMLSVFNQCFLKDGLLKKLTVREMVSQQAKYHDERRGLIWQLSGIGYTRTLSRQAFGHSGFTGCFAWCDPINSFSVVLVSNDVYNGRENRQLFKYRTKIMRLAQKCLS